MHQSASQLADQSIISSFRGRQGYYARDEVMMVAVAASRAIGQRQGLRDVLTRGKDMSPYNTTTSDSRAARAHYPPCSMSVHVHVTAIGSCL